MFFERIKENYELYKSHYFAGSELYCPFCARFFRMDEYGRSGAKSDHCPVCGSSKDERTILLFLQSRTNLLSGNLNILVIGEKNEITQYFKKFPNTDVKEFYPKADLSIKDQNINDKYPADHFDIILCNYVLEKQQDYFTVMNEMKRIVKSDGFIMLQANIDKTRESTLETHHQFYKDRFKIYGILGNFRRFGKDYRDVLKREGLQVMEYKYKNSIDEIPEVTMFGEYTFYLGYKDDPPVIKNYDETVDEAIDEHYASRKDKNMLFALIYLLFFLIPDKIKIKLLNIGNKISEKQSNHHRFEYFLFVLTTGMISYWGSIILFIFTGRVKNYFIGGIIHWFVAFPIFLTIGLTGFSMMWGYAYTTHRANAIQRNIMGVIFNVSFFVSVIVLVFGQG